jgi:release factor glutamine methyltransferase
LTVGEVLRASSDYLATKGVASPRVDAEHLVASGLGVSRLDLYLQHDRELTEDELTACRELVRRRAAREPLAYVLGEWGFRRLQLAVDRRALVPRPETEVVVERCLTLIADVQRPEVLDVGVGSGAIALSIAGEHPGAHVTALDISRDALELAAVNLERTGLGDRVSLVEGDLHHGLPGGPYDLVVSNPPYVDAEEIDLLEPEVRDWEPREALVGRGATESVARDAVAVLRSGGWLVLETADGKAEEVATLLSSLGFQAVGSSPDLSGRPRVVEGQWAS